MLADLALEAEPIAVSRQQQLDGGGVEADAVVQRLHLVLLVDTAQRHHRHQHLHVGDRRGIAREQRLQVHRVGCLDHKIDLVGRDVDARQFVDDLLREHYSVGEGRRFDDGRSILGVGGEEQIAHAVGLSGGDQSHRGVRSM